MVETVLYIERHSFDSVSVGGKIGTSSVTRMMGTPGQR